MQSGLLLSEVYLYYYIQQPCYSIHTIFSSMRLRAPYVKCNRFSSRLLPHVSLYITRGFVWLVVVGGEFFKLPRPRISPNTSLMGLCGRVGGYK